MWLDDDTGAIWKHESSGWVDTGTILSGPQGEVGPVGPVGPQGPGGAGGAIHEEFLPGSGATFVDLSQIPQTLLTVARAGVVQSADEGDYTLSGQRVTFADALTGTQRIVIAYTVTGETGGGTSVDGDLRRYVQQIMAILDPGGSPPPP